MVSLRTLVGIAGVGGIVTSLTGFILHGILQNRVKNSPAYRETMKMMNNHPVINEILGKPVQSERVDLGNKNNILSVNTSRLELPVSGPKTKGMLFIWADRISSEDKWNIYRVELEVLDNLGGRVCILNKDPLVESQ